MSTEQTEQERETQFSKLEVGENVVINGLKGRITSKVEPYMTLATRHLKDVILEIHYQVSRSPDTQQIYFDPLATIPIWPRDERYDKLNGLLAEINL